MAQSLADTLAQLNGIKDTMSSLKRGQTDYNDIAAKLGSAYDNARSGIASTNDALRSTIPVASSVGGVIGDKISSALRLAKLDASDLAEVQESYLNKLEVLDKLQESAQKSSIAKAYEFSRLKGSEILQNETILAQMLEKANQYRSQYDERVNLNKLIGREIELNGANSELAKSYLSQLEASEHLSQNIIYGLEKAASIKGTGNAASAKAAAAQLALDQARLSVAAEETNKLRKTFDLQKEGFEKAHAGNIAIIAAMRRLKDAASIVGYAMKGWWAESGIGLAIKRQAEFADAIKLSHGSLEERHRQLVQIETIQGITGLETQTLVSAEQALAESGLDRLSTNEENLRIIGMMAETYGVSESSSAKIAAQTNGLGGSFSHLANTIGALAKSTGLTASSIANIVEYSNKMQISLGGGAAQAEIMSKSLSAFGGVANKYGLDKDLLTHTFEGASASFLGGNRLGLAKGFTPTNLLGSESGLTDFIENLKNSITGLGSGKLAADPVRVKMFSDMLGISVEDIKQWDAFLARGGEEDLRRQAIENEAVASQKRVLQDFYDRQTALGKNFSELGRRFSNIAVVALDPLVKVLNSLVTKASELLSILGEFLTGNTVGKFIVNLGVLAGIVISTVTAFNALKGVIGLIKGSSALINPLISILPRLGTIAEVIAGSWGFLAAAVEGVIAGLVALASPVWGTVAAVAAAVAAVLLFANWLSDGAVMQGLTKLWGATVEFANSLFSWAAKFGGALFGATAETVKGIGRAISSYFKKEEEAPKLVKAMSGPSQESVTQLASFRDSVINDINTGNISKMESDKKAFFEFSQKMAELTPGGSTKNTIAEYAGMIENASARMASSVATQRYSPEQQLPSFTDTHDVSKRMEDYAASSHEMLIKINKTIDEGIKRSIKEDRNMAKEADQKLKVNKINDSSHKGYAAAIG